MTQKKRKVATDFARLIQNADRDVQYNCYKESLGRGLRFPDV